MTEQLATSQRVDLAVSTVIFALRPHPKTGTLTLWLPLVRRIRQPYEGRGRCRAARCSRRGPGDQRPAHPGADHRSASRRTWSSSTRSARVDRRRNDVGLGRLLGAGPPDEAALRWTVTNVEWFVADEVPRLAFDHNEIVDYALDRLRAKITYSPIARFSSVPSSPWPSCARCTKPCCASRSTPPTSVARSWPAGPSSRPATAAQAPVTARPALSLPAVDHWRRRSPR